jgi:acyl-CoA reductase-like NAD-dependent aldehyde dehydrogenase
MNRSPTSLRTHRRGGAAGAGCLGGRRRIGSLRFGTVWINDHGPIVSEMPFGGFKQSGMGKDMSLHALEDYSDLKHVMIRLG